MVKVLSPCPLCGVARLVGQAEFQGAQHMKNWQLLAGLPIAIIILMLFSLFVHVSIFEPMTSYAAQPGTPPPVGAAETTVAAEMTAVARFTLEPDVAASYTPDFAQIIARDLARKNLTATAIATLSPTVRYTSTPTITLTGTPMCPPSYVVRSLDTEATALDAQLIAADLDGNAAITVGYVEHIDGTCAAPQLPVNMQIAITVTIANIPESREERGDLLAPILDVVAWYELPHDLHVRYVSLRIDVIDGDGRFTFSPGYDKALQAVERGLTGVEPL